MTPPQHLAFGLGCAVAIASCRPTPNEKAPLGVPIAQARPAATQETAAATPRTSPADTFLRVPHDPGPRLVELVRRPTFVMVQRCRPESPVATTRDAFLEIPELTLYASGWAIYVADGTAQVTNVGSSGARAIREHVLGLGFEQLREQKDECYFTKGGRKICMEESDADMLTLGVRLPSGEMRHLKSYAGRANDREALASIVDYLEGWRGVRPQPYVSERGSLVIERCEPSPDAERWPLDPALLEPREGARLWIRVEEREVLSSLTHNGLLPLAGRAYRSRGIAFVVHWIPWLPDVDYSEAAARYLEPKPAPADG